jgi:hypothetical protein
MRGHPSLFTAVCWLLFASKLPASVLYVDVNSTNPVPPYADWSTASTDIQSAIDASSDGDQIWVNDGVYQTGGEVVSGFSLTNRVAINKAITVQSVNGPAATIIQGYQVPGTTNGSSAVRCVYLTTNAVISGFTLTNGATLNSGDAYFEESGGGLYCSPNSIATNCLVIVNSAYNNGGGASGPGTFSGGTLVNCSLIQNTAGLQGPTLTNAWWDSGGGVFGVTVINSLILSNNARYEGGGASGANLTNCIIKQNGSYAGGGAGGITGGGAYDCNLYGCLVVSNAANSDGGVSFGSTASACTIVGNFAYGGVGGFNGSSINDSIIYYNTVGTPYTTNYNPSATIRNCCTTPQPFGTQGSNNLTNEPAFVDLAVGNYHLQSNSLCINSGKNSYISITNDLDGNPRIVAGTVDMGAYEYQTPSSVLSYAWAQQYGFPTDGTADYADPDGDGMNNWQEWQAGTNPTNAASLLNILSISNSPSGTKVTWQIVSGKFYYVQRSTNLAVQPAFSTIATNLQRPLSSILPYTDTTATNGGPYFYRIGVQLQ